MNPAPTHSAMSSSQAVEPAGMDRRNVADIYPLSPMQQGLLFHTLLAPASGAYVVQVILTLRGALDGKRMAQAWQHVADRHPVLRTAFYWNRRDEPFQVVFRSLPVSWIEQDWSPLDAERQRVRLDALVAYNRSEPFDLQRPPLMRLYWINLGQDRFHLLWCHHHLILDGWSAALVLQDVFRAYAAPASLAPAPPPFAHHIAWLRQQPLAAALEFWDKELAGVTLPAMLPLARKHRDGQPAAPQPAHDELVLTSEETSRLQGFARGQRLTLNTLMQGALGLVMRRHGNEGDVVFGTTVSGRPATEPQAAGMVGLFINTVPVRVRMTPAATVTDWLARIQAAGFAASEHEHAPLRELQARHNHGRALFDCLLVLESYPAGTDPAGNVLASGDGAIALEHVAFDESTHFPLTLQVAPGERLRLGARYDRQQVDASEVAALLARMRTALLAFAETPNARLAQITVLTPAERAQRRQWNATAAEFPRTRTLADLFEAQAGARPEHAALVCGDETMSYAELDLRSNRLAHALRERGIGTEAVVGIYIERSLALMIAILGAQKAGAAYLPLDTDSPPARLRAMVEDAGPAAVLFDGSALATSAKERAAVVGSAPLIDVADAALARLPGDRLPRLPAMHAAAYVIYTSGSTGRPKGVVNNQLGIVNRLHWMQRYLQLGGDDCVLQKTPLGFDVSVWELFLPLIPGATLVIARPGGHRDREYLVRLIAASRVSVLHFVPSLLADFLEAPALEQRCAGLRHVVCSGEVLSGALQERFFCRLPQARLHNLYGPTEAAVDVTAWACAAEDGAQPVPIGRPISNLRIHITDADGHEVPVGASGRLFIGGIGVARGYLGRRALTAERFVPDWLRETTDPGETLYDTGDVARYRHDGAIEFLGRTDDQIKLNGVRIELAEVEAQLRALDGVQNAVVRFWNDATSPATLVAYVVPVAERDLVAEQWTAELAAALRSRLPTAMLPASYVVLDALPLNTSGKPDRKALPRPQAAVGTPVAPRTETERALVQIWIETLKLPAAPGVHDDFFALGGHSMIATRMITRIHAVFGVELALREIFDHPVLAALAARVDTQRGAAQAADGDQREIVI